MRNQKDARACVIGISNDLKFTDFLDPRVRSRLGQQDIVFNPYNAEQLQDILRTRAKLGISENAIGAGVIESVRSTSCSRTRRC